MASRWSGPSPPPPPFSNPFASDSRAHRSSLSYSRIPRLVYWTSLVTNVTNRRFRSRRVRHSLSSRAFDSSKFDSVLSNCNGRSFEIELRSNKISFVFSSSLENFSSIKFHATAAISNPRRFLPLDSTRGAESDVDRTRREKKKNSKSVEKASSSPRRRSKSCASLEEVARSEGEGGEGKDGGKR